MLNINDNEVYVDMDWASLERRPQSNSKQDAVSFKIETKKVRVSKDDLIRLPDGTVIVKDKKTK